MNIAVVYESTHHGNTKKLLDAIKAKYPDVMLYDINETEPQLGRCDIIGIASGVAYGELYKKITKYATDSMPSKKKVFFIYTCGTVGKAAAADSLKEYLEQKKGCKSLGVYACRGYDTYGPFKILGGVNKGCPNQSEIDGAVAFFDEIAGGEQ